MVGKAILTPKNVDVEKISELVLNRLPGDFTIYPSADSVDLSNDIDTLQPQVYSPKFLRTLSPSDSNFPFVLKRHQFPVRCGLFHDYQQILGLFAATCFFSWTTVCFFVKSYFISDIKVLIDNVYEKLKCQTRNVVYKEVFCITLPSI